MVTLRRLDSDLRPKRKELPADQSVLYDLLCHGVVNPRPRDHAFDASTRAMRYLAAITDWVWAMLDKETVIICQSPRSFPFLSPIPCPEHDVKLYQLCLMLHDDDRYVEQSLSQDTLV